MRKDAIHSTGEGREYAGEGQELARVLRREVAGSDMR